jgi:hypothetical protein
MQRPLKRTFPPNKMPNKAKLKSIYFKNALLLASSHLKYNTTTKIISFCFSYDTWWVVTKKKGEMISSVKIFIILNTNSIKFDGNF